MNRELYYAMANIVDALALRYETITREGATLYEMLDTLSRITDITPKDFGSANDCGICDDWIDVVVKTRELFKKGERVSV